MKRIFGVVLSIFVLGGVFLLFMVLSESGEGAFWWGMGIFAALFGLFAFVRSRILSKREAAQTAAASAEKDAGSADAQPPALPEQMQAEAVSGPVERHGSLLYAGSFRIGPDLPAGRYDLCALSGEGTAELVKKDGTRRFCVSLSAENRHESAEYRNAILEDGDALTLSGAFTAGIRPAN